MYRFVSRYNADSRLLSYKFCKIICRTIRRLNCIFDFYILGAKVIKEAFDEEKGKPVCIDLKCLLLVGIATSIDAFSAGITLSLFGNHIFKPALLITFITFANSILGFSLGGKLKHLPTKGLEIFAGLLLIALGIKAII